MLDGVAELEAACEQLTQRLLLSRGGVISRRAPYRPQRVADPLGLGWCEVHSDLDMQAPDNLAGKVAALKNRAVFVHCRTVACWPLRVKETCEVLQIKQTMANGIFALSWLTVGPVRARLSLTGGTTQLLTVGVLEMKYVHDEIPHVVKIHTQVLVAAAHRECNGIVRDIHHSTTRRRPKERTTPLLAIPHHAYAGDTKVQRVRLVRVIGCVPCDVVDRYDELRLHNPLHIGWQTQHVCRHPANLLTGREATAATEGRRKV
jgi:hypothetical protein